MAPREHAELANEASAIGVIPARYGSSRVPAKPLVELGGKPMIERVWTRACQARTLERVIIATDDERIAAVARRFAPAEDVLMTSREHVCGSDRVAEVARGLEAEIFVNIQGDLPLLEPAMVDGLVERLRAQPTLEMATAAFPIEGAEEMAEPSVVKVVVGQDGRALYFSRAPIPYDRSDPGSPAHALHHIGLYAYRRETLLRFASLGPTELENTEKLEQLRALDHGIGIDVVTTEGGIAAMEVDTPEDLEAVREALDDPGL